MARKSTKRGKRAPQETDAEIGRKLRLLRMERNMSQQELGRVLDVTFQQIQKYEKGVNRVSAGRLVELAEQLNTTPHDLVGWKKTNNSDTPMMDIEGHKLWKIIMRLPIGPRVAIRKLAEALDPD